MSNVELTDRLGTDLTIANAARVSLHKWSEFDVVGPFSSEITATGARCKDPNSTSRLPWQSGGGWVYQRVKDADAQLINYCARERHFSPFTHCIAQFRIKMPLFLARQWYKSRIGLEKDCGWNEVSRRYVKDEPEFFEVEKGFRKAAEKIKQGSTSELVTKGFEGKSLVNLVKAHNDSSRRLYLGMLEAGVAAEDARMVLPVAMMTEWIETGSIMAYARMVKLRADDHAQSYIRPYANDISTSLSAAFPISWRALMENDQ
jgi:thymidylate synthase (FAD)